MVKMQTRSLSLKTWAVRGCLALVLVVPGAVAAQAFDRIVVFGTSLSDPGNAFALVGGTTTPPFYSLAKLNLIPDAPYTGGGGGSHHFSNGPTWVEQLGRTRGLARSVRPAFRASNPGATNYAIGGARARNAGDGNLSAQVDAFLSAIGNAPAPSNALYVIEMGGNDIRDVLLTGNAGIISDALTSIGQNIGRLYARGARKFLVWKVPNVGLTPAVKAAGPTAVAFAGLLTQLFNDGLEGMLQTNFAGVDIVRFDVNITLNAIIADPGQFQLTNVDVPCVTPGVPPFNCKNADEYLFWDGIHPTTTVHGIIAQQVGLLLPQ
jgi:outer membrane lipase/esterase